MMNFFEDFINSCCEIDKDYMIYRLDIYTSYREHLERFGAKPLNIYDFIDKMVTYNFNYNNLIFYGVRLKAEYSTLPIF